MKACIVTCYESNEPRVSLVKEAFERLNYRTSVITTNFSHMKKITRNNIPNDYIAISVKPYQKNLSIDRIKSHIDFSKRAFEIVEKQVPDIIWICAPANSLIKEANEYKKRYPLVKVIIDIIDMWPESLPIKLGKSLLPFQKWKNIRKDNINCADKLVVECDLYKDILATEYRNSIQTIHWGKNIEIEPFNYHKDEDRLHLVYLGSINNIIDIRGMRKMISKINKKVTVHIIGEGENKEKMISELSAVCRVEDHGIIYDEKIKSEILSKCHAGINLYKKGLYIGLTVKCIDYFANGLPIINNIPRDTWELVEKNNVGLNLNSNFDINESSIYALRKDYKRIERFFELNFSKEVIIKEMMNTISGVIQ